MRILEKQDKTNRVMVSVFPISEGRKRIGSKSLTVLDANVEEVYNLIVEALKTKGDIVK